MLLIEKIVEEKLAQARADGQFDDSPLKGVPYRFDGYLYENPSERVFYKILHDHCFLPLPLELKRKIEQQLSAIDELLHTTEHRYRRRFRQLIDLLNLELHYPPEDFSAHLKSHHRFLQNDLKIWLTLKSNSRTRMAVQMFNKMQQTYFQRYQEMVIHLLELIDAYNEEVVKLCLKQRDRFRVMTTLGKKPLHFWIDYFHHRFPRLPVIHKEEVGLP